jgi:hypothetical protein
MQEWEAVFLDTPRLYETVPVFLLGKRYETSHIMSVETLDGTDPISYRVKTMSGGIYVGPIGSEPELEIPETSS